MKPTIIATCSALRDYLKIFNIIGKTVYLELKIARIFLLLLHSLHSTAAAAGLGTPRWEAL